MRAAAMAFDEVASGVDHAGPVMRFTGRHRGRPDVDRLDPPLDLTLRAVGDDLEAIVAETERYVVEAILAIGRFARKGDEFAVAIQFGVPSGRELAAELGAVEGDRLE